MDTGWGREAAVDGGGGTGPGDGESPVGGSGLPRAYDGERDGGDNGLPVEGYRERYREGRREESHGAYEGMGGRAGRPSPDDPRAGSSMWTNLLPVVVVLVVLGVWTRARRLHQRRRETREKAPAPGALPRARQARDDADRILVDMLELGRELLADAATRMQMLNELVKEADERIRVLRALADEVNVTRSTEATSAPSNGMRDGAAASPTTGAALSGMESAAGWKAKAAETARSPYAPVFGRPEATAPDARASLSTPSAARARADATASASAIARKRDASPPSVSPSLAEAENVADGLPPGVPPSSGRTADAPKNLGAVDDPSPDAASSEAIPAASGAGPSSGGFRLSADDMARRVFFRRVHALDAQGKTVGEIATSLGVSSAEVNIALALGEPAPPPGRGGGPSDASP